MSKKEREVLLSILELVPKLPVEQQYRMLGRIEGMTENISVKEEGEDAKSSA